MTHDCRWCNIEHSWCVQRSRLPFRFKLDHKFYCVVTSHFVRCAHRVWRPVCCIATSVTVDKVRTRREWDNAAQRTGSGDSTRPAPIAVKKWLTLEQSLRVFFFFVRSITIVLVFVNASYKCIQVRKFLTLQSTKSLDRMSLHTVRKKLRRDIN